MHAALPAAMLLPSPWSGALVATWGVANAVLTAALLHPRSQLLGPTIWQGPHVPRIAVTFDDGPHPEDLPAILDALAASGGHGTRATFFFVATRVIAQPELARRVVAAGHEVGAHGWKHPWWFSFAPRARLRQEVGGAARIIEDITGQPIRWYRPPMGHKNIALAEVAAEAGLRVVTWSARAFDTRGGSAARIRGALRVGLRPGAILLLHEGVRRRPAAMSPSVEALPGILEDARAAGLEPVPLADLLPQN